MTSLKNFLLNLLRRAVDRWPRRPGVRYILLDSRSALTATYLEDLRAVLAEDPRLKFYKVVRPNLTPEDQQRSLAPVNCPRLPYRIAKFFPWDLLVLADHPTDHLDDLSARYGALRIPHGIGGKMVHGHDYLYGPALYDRAGRPRYTAIFEASSARRARFVAADPALAGIVRLVGDLRLDKLASTAGRARRRPASDERPTVLIAASWNEGNLLEKIGAALCDAAAGLLGAYAFVLRPHPHFFDTARTPQWHGWLAAQKTRGFVISPPTEDLGWIMTAATVVICDDLSSVVLYAAALQQRIILVPSGNDQIPADSFPARLRRMVPILEHAGQLPTMLALVVSRPPEAALRPLALEINSRPGEAANLAREEVRRLLALTLQTAPALAPHVATATAL